MVHQSRDQAIRWQIMSMGRRIFCGVDPDLHCTAIAWIDCSGKLIDVEFTKVPAKIKESDAVVATLSQLTETGLRHRRCQYSVVEGQKYYRGKSRVPANDLILLAQVSGAAAVLLADVSTVEIPLPQTWKGSIPKPIHQARICKKLGVPYERRKEYCVPDLHRYQFENPEIASKILAIPSSKWKHLLDAVGLAQYALKRWQSLCH